MSQDSVSKLKVAICGAGISSLCLAFGLSKNAHIEVKIYESSPTFRDEGAAVGLGPNAQDALHVIAPELRAALDRAGGTAMIPSATFYMGTGPEAGTYLGEVGDSHMHQIVVARSPFAATLRSMLPDGTLQMGKKLVNADDQDPGPVILAFADGSNAQADCLIGCDGVNSTVRALVLGPDNPALHPKYTGGHGFRTLVPLQDAITDFGEEYCKNHTQKVHVGDGGALLTDYSNDGTSVQLIAGFSGARPWPHSVPWVSWPKDEFATSMSRWGTIGNTMATMFCAQDQLYAAGSRTHGPAPTYVLRRLCIAGDAAHTFPPARGAGAGQAIEDALILSTTLASAHSSADVRAALVAYDAVRRPRRSMVAAMSEQGMRLLTGREPGVGLDVDKWRGQLAVWNKEIYHHDQQEACARAMKVMKDVA